MSKKEREYTEEYLYLGERVNFLGRISKVFRNKKGEISSWNPKGVYFGESYLASKDGYMKSSFPPQPEKQTIFPTDRDKAEYEAHKVMAADTRARRKKEREFKKPSKDILRAIELLRPYARYLDSIELGRFCGYIQNQLSKRRKK